MSSIETLFVGCLCQRIHRCHDLGNLQQESTKTVYFMDLGSELHSSYWARLLVGRGRRNAQQS